MSSTASCKVLVNLPREKVWEGLRDLSRAPFYVPNLTGAEFTTAEHTGVGASRRVFQVKGKPLDETVESWDEGYGFLLRLHDGDKSPAPFKKAWFDYRIADAPDGKTYFMPSLIYDMPWGPLGAILNLIVIGPFARKSTQAVADNFKLYYETGAITNPAYKP